MGWIIIEQEPEKKYGIFSTIVDAVIVQDLTKDELFALYRKDAADVAERQLKDTLEHHRGGSVITMEEALRRQALYACNQESEGDEE